jgi:hypothetical protein
MAYYQGSIYSEWEDVEAATLEQYKKEFVEIQNWKQQYQQKVMNELKFMPPGKLMKDGSVQYQELLHDFSELI